MKLHVGTSGFGYTAWRGKFYPKKLPAEQMLRYYSEHFNAVEINNTFFRMPNEAQLQAWSAEVSGDFTFAIKSPRQITHSKRLANAEDPSRRLFSVTKALGERQGPVLFQLPPTFKKDLPRLRDFLAQLPQTRRVAFEFRHPSWFEDDVLASLRQHHAALCIADDENDLIVPFEATADCGYLRLRRLDYTPKNLTAWAARIAGQSWREAFIFFKHEDKAIGASLAVQFKKLVSQSGR